MAKFRITADGAVYDVEAPDEAAAMGALDEMRGGAAPQPPSTAADVGHAIPSGVASGVALAAGTPGSLGDLAQQGVDWARRKITGKTEQQEKDEAKATVGKFLDSLGAPKVPMNEEPIRVRGSANPASTQNLTRLGDAAMGEYGPSYKPQPSVGKFAKAGTEGAVAAAMVPVGGGLAARGLQGATAGLGSEAAGQATNDNPWARVAGGVVGALAPSMLARTFTPFPASPAHQAQVDVLRRQGVNPTAGQATGNKALRYFEGEMGGNRAAREMDRVGEEFTGAALRRVGENANRATPEVIDQAFTRIGQQFDDLAARNVAVADRQFGQDIGRVVHEYDRLVATPAPAVRQEVEGILQTLVTTGGAIPGDVYQAARSRLDRFARSAAADPQLSHTLRGVRNALDDLMERNMAPADQAAWREARTQYRNILAVEKAATGAGQPAAEGIISPSAMRNATITEHGRRNYARGDGDFAELARAGEAVLKPLPDSGTASRLASRWLPQAASSGVGAILGASAGGPTGAGVGALAGPLLARGVGHAAMTRPVQALLANQLLAGTAPGADARAAALAQALMRSSSLQTRE
jgi:hypothetical protein